jgi:hypothetical protein
MDMSPNPHIGLKKTKERMNDLKRSVDPTPTQPLDSRPVIGFQIGWKLKLAAVVVVITLLAAGIYTVTAVLSVA